FERLARALRGSTDECVISFAQAYRKTARRLDAAAAAGGFTWMDPDDEQKRRLAGQLADIAAANAMALTLCGQRALLVPGVSDARCIDPVRMADVAGQPVEVRAKGHRSECGCCASRDIGAY